MIFALAGNQNCGKTTLFNQLTGSNQHVGNFPYLKSLYLKSPCLKPLRLSQILHDKLDLTRRKSLGTFLVARSFKILNQRLATAYPRHQVSYGRARSAVGEVHQSEFLLCIEMYIEIRHIVPFFEVNNNQHNPCT